ncbi:hypothetical protein [Achromobacter spanius]|uniref:Uncharacterized protein n=1 Tax=Achromobacter spanius TaxID=217203 RepID=A0A2S0IB76_9BURK|nr:hypothetical protein [Achromobacter spanius]AVJ29301.1 hypothetical protein CLM73_20525 [Achromobacter spanius]
MFWTAPRCSRSGTATSPCATCAAPQTSDTIRGLDRLQPQNFHGSLLLGLIYGQSFSNNLFLIRLVQMLDAASQPHDSQHELKGFLRSHRKALMEKVIE